MSYETTPTVTVLTSQPQHTRSAPVTLQHLEPSRRPMAKPWRARKAPLDVAGCEAYPNLQHLQLTSRPSILAPGTTRGTTRKAAVHAGKREPELCVPTN